MCSKAPNFVLKFQAIATQHLDLRLTKEMNVSGFVRDILFKYGSQYRKF